jgi:hypothetical protein
MQFSPEFVGPLGSVENHLLQILLTRFELHRSEHGATLSVQFDEGTPALWTRHAKRHIKSCISGFDQRKRGLQQRLDAVLLERSTNFDKFNEPEFPFRYGSGGVLPIVRMGRREFFCLFYRDIDPVGWNIANGGTDSRAELLYPLTTIEREFREELVVLKPPPQGERLGGRRYVFEWGVEGLEDRAEYAMARKLWASVFPEWDVQSFPRLKLPVQWLEGPDSIRVQMGNEQPVPTTGCFLNINTEDFGIEVDRVAKIWVPEDAVLLDGEILDQRVLNRPVGLFDVDNTVSQFREKSNPIFFPDYFFYGGKRYGGTGFIEAIEKHLTPSLPEFRPPAEVSHFASIKDKNKFVLCPVTRTLLRRYSDFLVEQQLRIDNARGLPGTQEKAIVPEKFDIFISFADDDEQLARRVFDYVKNEKGRSPFFYKDHMVSRWGRLLADALDSADCMIVVGTDVNRFNDGWLEHEWFAFLNAINIKRKPRAKFIPFVVGIDDGQVPIVWLPHQIVHGDVIERGLRELGDILDRQ